MMLSRKKLISQIKHLTIIMSMIFSINNLNVKPLPFPQCIELLYKQISTMNYCIFDTETNGLPFKNDYSNVYMTQIAIIITNGRKNFIEKEYLVKGDFEVSSVITELTGITKEMTDKNGQSFSVIWNDINKLLKKYNCSLSIAHNSYFDMNVIKQEYRRMKNLKFGNFGEQDLTEELEILSELNSFNIFNKTFFNKYKYKKELLKQMLEILSKNKSNINGVLDIIFKFNKNKKLYNEPFFQLIPVCSLMFFRKKIPKTDIENYKLQTIHQYYHGDYEQQHTALDDCWMLQRCLDETSDIMSLILR